MKYLNQEPINELQVEPSSALQQEARKRISNFQLTSDLFLGKVLEDARACEEVIGILTGRNIRIQEVESQYSIRQLETRSVILDIYAVEEDGTRLTLEMHPRADEDHLRRNRYNIGSIDMNLLDKGVEYEQLPEVYGIYLSKKKFGTSNAAIREVIRKYNNAEDCCDEADCPDNGVHEYYVNLSGKADTKEQEALIRFLVNSDVTIEHEAFPNLVRRVRFLKEDDGGFEIMCEIMDELMEMSKELGKEQGIELGKESGYMEMRKQAIEKLVKNAGMTLSQAMNTLEVPEEERKHYMDMLVTI
ncbi:MAG: PD-(D/E)XK nuclease family transposase [Eubacteriales bacterium]